MKWICGSAVDLLFEEDEEFVFGEAALFAGVAVAEGNGAVFFDRVEVDGDAEGGADFVLAAIAAADGTGGVVEDVPAALEFCRERARVRPVPCFSAAGRRLPCTGAMRG